MSQAIDWKVWNSFRASIGSSAKMAIAIQCLQDVATSMERFDNELESDVRQAANIVKLTKKAFADQWTAKQKAEERSGNAAQEPK